MTTATRADGKLTVALISEVFWEPDGVQRMKQRLAEVAERGADLAVLPELPLNQWRPSTREAKAEDAEPMDGPRATAQQQAATAKRPSGEKLMPTGLSYATLIVSKVASSLPPGNSTRRMIGSYFTV